MIWKETRLNECIYDFFVVYDSKDFTDIEDINKYLMEIYHHTSLHTSFEKPLSAQNVW